MRTKKLPREMLWSDKTTMSEFLTNNLLNQELHKTFLKLKGDSTFIRLSEEQVFNEVYFQLSRMSYESALDLKLEVYISDIKENLSWSYAADLVLSMAYVVGAMTLDPSYSLSRQQLKVIKDRCWHGLFWHPFFDCLKRIEKKGIKQMEGKSAPHVTYIIQKVDQFNAILGNNPEIIR